MFRLKKIHKYAGITSGIMLILLSISGFFLNHDNWKFLYTTTLPNTILPQATIEKDKRLLNAYYVAKDEPLKRLFCGFRGVQIQIKPNSSYETTLNLPCYAMVASEENYFTATTEGIYISKNSGETWNLFALEDEVVTALSLDKEKLLAVIDKTTLVLLNKEAKVLYRTEVALQKELLDHDISLGRLVRDVHYGRGLFDDGLSLLWNDFATLWLILLAVTGYMLWYMIGKIRVKKRYKKPIGVLLKIHTSSWVLLAVFPLILLVITGIFLDHSKFFSSFLHQTKVSHKILPPVYSTLKEDIWSADIYNGIYRIGNRYGVYKSTDLKNWVLESKGFAYKMMHDKDAVYVSGMGASNRVLKDNTHSILKDSPHMFKSMYIESNKQMFFSSCSLDLDIPKYTDTTLYSFLLSLHDGTFFASWWVFVNDFVSVLLLVLLYTGLRLWYRRVRLSYNKK
ncbi:MAG: PepSY domain-containing protein [Sulfurovum sp.]|nr:PepSY domain-containing protein [Sulfurovum sp.]